MNVKINLAAFLLFLIGSAAWNNSIRLSYRGPQYTTENPITQPTKQRVSLELPDGR